MRTRQRAYVALLPLLIALVLSTTGAVVPAGAAEPAHELMTAPWSTDLDNNGATGLADFAIFGCAFLGGNGCPPCAYTRCTPFACDNTCPLSLPCDCGSGVPTIKSDFSCDGMVGLNDLARFGVAYILEVTSTGKCP